MRWSSLKESADVATVLPGDARALSGMASALSLAKIVPGVFLFALFPKTRIDIPAIVMIIAIVDKVLRKLLRDNKPGLELGW